MSHHKVEYKINTIDSFILNVLYCFIIQKEKETTLNEEYKKHTIYIYANEKNAINFLSQHDWKLDLAVDAYYLTLDSGPRRDINRNNSQIDKKKLDQIWNLYKGKNFNVN
jgi:hypothetical protein